jgi:hypothetical protein
MLPTLTPCGIARERALDLDLKAPTPVGAKEVAGRQVTGPFTGT